MTLNLDELNRRHVPNCYWNNERCEWDNDFWPCTTRQLLDRLTELERDMDERLVVLRRTEAALAKYGRHTANCAARHVKFVRGPEPGICTCGLELARAAIEETTDGSR